MKELSIEEKAKAYDEAFERAKQWCNTPNVNKIPTFANRVIKEIFPELKESEDESIRKELIDYCKNRAEKYPNDPKYKNISAWIAWLEKQGSEENKGNHGGISPNSAWKPSDEQIKVCKEVCADILSAKGFDLGTVNSELNRMEEQLKKLKGE